MYLYISPFESQFTYSFSIPIAALSYLLCLELFIVLITTRIRIIVRWDCFSFRTHIASLDFLYTWNHNSVSWCWPSLICSLANASLEVTAGLEVTGLWKTLGSQRWLYSAMFPAYITRLTAGSFCHGTFWVLCILRTSLWARLLSAQLLLLPVSDPAGPWNHQVAAGFWLPSYSDLCTSLFCYLFIFLSFVYCEPGI